MKGAIQTARNGWSVTEDLVKYMKAGMASAVVPNFLIEEPNWAIDFAPNGTLLGMGDTITRKRYADTLETIAESGPDAFYNGPIAEATIAAVRAANGTMTMADLHNYTIITRPTANITYRGYRLFSCSAPSSGEVVLSVMKTLELYPDLYRIRSGNLSTHRLDEAIRFGYGGRTSLGDPSFVKNLTAYQNEMLSEATARYIRSKISDARTLNVSAYDPKGIESLETRGTSQVVTADASGMAVSLTTTINLLFGSQVLVPETGVIMNNEMNDFSIPGSSNAFGYMQVLPDTCARVSCMFLLLLSEHRSRRLTKY